VAVDEHVEIGQAVAVVVERGADVQYSFSATPAFAPTLLERAVAAVAVEQVRPEQIRDVEVGRPSLS
jgi:hypothetical protein